MTEKTFQMITRVGAILVAITVLGNAWLVLRHWELNKRSAANTQRGQEMSMRKERMQGLLQEVLVRTQNNPQVIQILQRYNLVSGAPAAPPPAKR